MNADIQFLKDLQYELNTQEVDCQASPKFWTVGDYEWVESSSDNSERVSVFLPEPAEAYEINELLKEIKDDDFEELEEEAIEEFKEIECDDSALDWIVKHYDEGAYMFYEKKQHCIHPNTMFLTKEEAKRHIELNHYHYTKEAHTYAMTAWRAPKVERLFKILETLDWNEIEQLKEDKSFFVKAYTEKIMSEE